MPSEAGVNRVAEATLPRPRNDTARRAQAGGARPARALYSGIMRKPFPPVVPSIVFAAVAAVAAAPSWGWIDTGHKVVALIAWEDLTPKTKAAVTAALKGHPRYDKDLLSGGTMEPQPADALAGMTPDDRDRRAFAASAVWPDLVKAQSHPMRVKYSHSNWHYIDMPLVVATPGSTTQPTAPEEKGGGPGPHDVVAAINQCVAELKDPATSAEQRAVDVCWVTHLIGDIHQPLHTATLVSSHFPKGDVGGNDEVVLKDARYTNTRMNLHLLWDSLPGDFASDDLCRYEALGLRADPHFARSTFAKQLADHDVMDWAKATHELAVHDAYLDGHLDAAAALPGSRGMRTDRPAPGVPAGYMRNAEHVALRQVALAGYRLADTLNAIYDPAAARR